MQGAPDDEGFGSDSTKFVKVPWDVMQAYLFRASRSAMLLPEASRSTWLEGRDVADRAAWVSQFREGEESLGQVVQSTMEKRGAHWDTPIQNVIIQPPSTLWGYTGESPGAADGPNKQKQGQHKGTGKHSPLRDKGPPSQPAHQPSSPSNQVAGSTAMNLRDGTSICQDFNSGKCPLKGPSCAKGVHRCSKILKGGRPCGTAFHTATVCRNP